MLSNVDFFNVSTRFKMREKCQIHTFGAHNGSARCEKSLFFCYLIPVSRFVCNTGTNSSEAAPCKGHCSLVPACVWVYLCWIVGFKLCCENLKYSSAFRQFSWFLPIHPQHSGNQNCGQTISKTLWSSVLWRAQSSEPLPHSCCRSAFS